MDRHEYVQACYILKGLKQHLARTITDAVAAESLRSRIDNVEAFLGYLAHDEVIV